ncbi:type IX secretion system ring subunit PorN/GldN [Taibaiella koreensis]|uniref:type IX secretion system ring protein PorN/GldN n=1 Tax=Taibaiella koreensis TaxID=1268548 RepID=UPI000E59AD88|nr:gliding motility protein GldN [Taibaiella koreensis]
MNILNKIGLTLGILSMGSMVFAQNPSVADPSQPQASADAVNATWKPSLVKDGIIDKVPHLNKTMGMTDIREADAAWKRRVWRQIDVRQKQNQAFVYEGDEYSGGGSFIEILIDAVKKGKISAYGTMDDRFTTPLDMEAFEKTIGGTEDSTMVEDPITGEQTWVKVRKEFDINSVTKYQIKEDWIFDRNTGRMVVRIIGVAPLQDRMDDNNNLRGSLQMFWLYYPDLRKLLANYEVYNPQNDLHRMSWADFFDGRYFASYVVKTSANNARGLKFSGDLRGLEEGDKAIEVLREKEDDMWQR